MRRKNIKKNSGSENTRQDVAGIQPDFDDSSFLDIVGIPLRMRFRREIERKDFKIYKPGNAPCPDEINLSKMAKASLNYLRGNPDPGRDYECKFALGPLGIPFHVPASPPNKYGYDVISLGDTDSRMEMQYAHMREMVGEPEPDPVEIGVRRRVTSYMRKDHLSWMNPGASVGKTIAGEWVSTWATSKLLCSISETFQRCGGKSLKQRARKIFCALRDIAIWDGTRAFYWGAPYKDGQWLLHHWTQYHGRDYPFIVEPLVRYYECTGDEEGLALARAFADGFLDEVQPELGEHRINPATGAFRGHAHMHTHAVWGVAHLGAILGEKRYLDWSRKVHDFVVSIGTDYGWYPERYPQGECAAEVCVVGDMVSLGAWLARGGRPEYWDVIERTIRNLLYKAQFSLTPGFVKLFEKINQDKTGKEVEKALNALRSIEGGFVSQPTYDDWVAYPRKMGTPGFISNGIQMMGCCPPEGMRALWEAWNGIIEQKKEGVFVNLPFTRDHQLARVTAFRPEDGRMEVEAKTSGDYFLRPPAWSLRSHWQLARNGVSAPVYWGGQSQAYVVCRNVKRGEKLAVTWIVPQFTQVFMPASVPDASEKVACYWIGNKVSKIEPKGRYLPMFK